MIIHCKIYFVFLFSWFAQTTKIFYSENFQIYGTYVCMYVGMYVCLYVCCMYVCMYVACMYVCMHVCMYVFVCMYVCMYVFVCCTINTFVLNNNSHVVKNLKMHNVMYFLMYTHICEVV